MCEICAKMWGLSISSSNSLKLFFLFFVSLMLGFLCVDLLKKKKKKKCVCGGVCLFSFLFFGCYCLFLLNISLIDDVKDREP